MVNHMAGKHDHGPKVEGFQDSFQTLDHLCQQEHLPAHRRESACPALCVFDGLTVPQKRLIQLA